MVNFQAVDVLERIKRYTVTNIQARKITRTEQQRVQGRVHPL